VPYPALPVPPGDAAHEARRGKRPAQRVWAQLVGETCCLGEAAQAPGGCSRLSRSLRRLSSSGPALRPSAASRTARRTGTGSGMSAGFAPFPMTVRSP